MTLRKQINKIIDSDTSYDKALLIIQYLEDEGISLDGNGWLDNDTETSELLYEGEILEELEKVLKEQKK